MKPESPKRHQPFRRLQAVNPVPSKRQYGTAKTEKKNFDVYVSDIVTGEETLAITVYAPTQREAIQIARKRLFMSPLLKRIAEAAFTAVEMKP
jgi:hypothetical protein